MMLHSLMNQKFFRELAEKEDFIVIGRCADVILKNNNIPHISVFITAPVEQRAKRIMELEKIPYSKALKRLVKFDKKGKNIINSILITYGDRHIIMTYVSTVQAMVLMKLLILYYV